MFLLQLYIISTPIFSYVYPLILFALLFFVCMFKHFFLNFVGLFCIQVHELVESNTNRIVILNIMIFYLNSEKN
jgi:hypothetical protein